MGNFNRVILMGNMTREPELKYIPSGTAVTEVTLAINDRRKGPNGDWVDETTFVDVTLWGRTAEVVSEYCSKGSPLFIEGRLKLDTWEKDGKKNYKLRVVGDRIQLISARGGGGQGGPAGGGGGGNRARQPARGGDGGGGGYSDEYSQPAGQESYGAPQQQEDDIPF